MKYHRLVAIMRFAAVSGNILFVLWMTYNAVNERFEGTRAEIASYIGLVGLFSLNSFLILRRPR